MRNKIMKKYYLQRIEFAIIFKQSETNINSNYVLNQSSSKACIIMVLTVSDCIFGTSAYGFRSK